MPAVELVTVGQRKGLGLLGGGPARYVVDVDAAAALVTVGTMSDLLMDEQRVRTFSWAADDAEPAPTRRDPYGLVQCSAHGGARPADVTVSGDTAVVRWHEPQRRVAPGQSVVVYDRTNTFVLGGGVAA